MNSAESDQRVTRYSINACTQCRQLHKKCDKKLPNCTWCTKLNKICTYAVVKKRGPKSRSEYNCPYPHITFHRVVENATKENEPTFANSNRFSALLIPVLPKEHLIRALTYVEQEWMGSTHTGQPDAEDLALIYATQSVFFYCQGNQSKAKTVFEKCKVQIVGCFDRVGSSFFLALCFMYMGMYSLLIGDDERTSFFVEHVKLFLRKHATTSNSSILYLEMLCDSVQNLLSTDLNVERMLKSLIIQHTAIREFMRTEFKTPEYSSKMLSIIADTDLADHDVEKIRGDLRTNSTEYELDGNRIALLSCKFSDIHERMAVCCPESFLQFKKYEMTLLLQGVYLQQCMKAQNMDLMMQSADAIAQMIGSSVYDKNYVTVGSVVALAAKVHLQILGTTQDLSVRISAMENLQCEYNTLNVIRQRNKLIGTKFEDVLMQMTHRLGGVHIARCMNDLPSGLMPVALIEMEAHNAYTLEECEDDLLSIDTYNFLADFE
jgi:hypothetical protein